MHQARRACLRVQQRMVLQPQRSSKGTLLCHVCWMYCISMQSTYLTLHSQMLHYKGTGGTTGGWGWVGNFLILKRFTSMSLILYSCFYVNIYLQYLIYISVYIPVIFLTIRTLKSLTWVLLITSWNKKLQKTCAFQRKSWTGEERMEKALEKEHKIILLKCQKRQVWTSVI